MLRHALVAAALLAGPAAAQTTAPAPPPVEAAAPTPASPKLSTESTVADLLANPASKAVLEKHVPGIVADERLGMVMGMKFTELQQFPEAQLTPEMVATIGADLAKL